MTMRRASSGSVIALLLAVVGATPAAGASPMPSAPVPTMSAAASPSAAAATTFTSDTYGYSMTLPPDWMTVQATAAWDGQGAPGSSAPEADQFVGPATASAWAYAAPTTDDPTAYIQDRIAGNFADHSDTCPQDPEVQEPIVIGGDAGTFLAWDCGILINQAVLVHDGIGYVFGFRDPAIHAATDVADRATFEQLIGEVSFPG